MRTWILSFVVMILAIPPVGAGEGRHGIGVGVDIGTTELDDSDEESIDFIGFNVYGKFGITDHWGIFVNYRDMEDDEDLAFGEEDSYRQVGVHAAYMFRPEKVFRPHVKLGATWTDLEARASFGTFSDSDIGLAIGAGFEAGPPRFAFFLDWEITEASIELFPGAELDLTIDDLTLGFIYKF